MSRELRIGEKCSAAPRTSSALLAWAVSSFAMSARVRMPGHRDSAEGLVRRRGRNTGQYPAWCSRHQPSLGS